MTLLSFVRENQSLADTEVVATFNALPENFQPIPSHVALGWIGGGGRLAKIEGFIEATEGADDANIIGLRSALKTLLIAVNNPNASLRVHPGADHHLLLLGAVEAGAISQDDADALLALGRVEGFELATAESVANVKDEIQAENLRSDREQRLADSHSAALVVIEQAGEDSAVESAFLEAWRSDV